MFVYIFILVVLLFGGILEVSGALNKNSHKILYLVIVLIFWLLSFIRWETGTDWDSYLSFFQNNNYIDDFFQSGIEPLFALINYLVKSFTDQYWVLLLVIGGIIYSLSAPTIYKYSPLPIVSLLVYLMLRKADIFFVRESIALAFCLFSTKFIINRKLVPFAICILLGFFFHKSIVVFIPAYYLFNLKLDPKKCVFLILILALIVIAVHDRISSSLSQAASLFGDYFLYKTENYMENDVDYGGGQSAILSALPRGLFNRGVLLAMILYAVSRNKQNEILRGFANLYIVSIIIYITLMPLSIVLSRLANAYDIFCILALGYFIKSVPRKNRQFVFLLFYIYMATRFVFGTLLGSYSAELLPYKTIFSM